MKWTGVLLMFAAACGGSSPVMKQPVPAALRSLESNGEGLTEAGTARNFTQASTILSQSQSSWITLKPQVLAAGAHAETMGTVEDAFAKAQEGVTAQDARAVATQGNAISRTVPDLFDFYSYPVPSDALRLDAHMRLLQIDGGYTDWPAAAADAAMVTMLWARFRPTVVLKAPKRTDVVGSQTVVADMDANVAALAEAVSGRDGALVAQKTTDGLNLIDTVEQVF